MRKISRLATALLFIGSLSVSSSSFGDSVNFADTEPPTVDLMKLSNQVIEVSKGSNKLLIDISVSDNLNSLEWVYTSIYRETPGPREVSILGNKYLNSPISTRIEGGRVTLKYQAVFEIPKGFASGRYYVYSFAKDLAGNYPSNCLSTKYCVYQMSKVLPEAIFEVKNDGSGKTIDVSEFDLNAKYSEISQKYDLLNKTVSGLQSQITALTNEKFAFQNQTNSLTSEKTSLQSQVSALTSDKISLQSQVSALGAAKDELATLKKRLGTICKARPKPKGC